MGIGRQMLAALPGTSLSLRADWTRLFSAVWKPGRQLDTLRRAELRTRTEIRAAFERLAAEFDISGHEVDEAMAQVDDALSELTGEVEDDLAYDAEQADQY